MLRQLNAIDGTNATNSTNASMTLIAVNVKNQHS